MEFMQAENVRTLLYGNLLGAGSPILEAHLRESGEWNSCVIDLLKLHLAFSEDLRRLSGSVAEPTSNLILSTVVAHAYNTTCEALGLGYRGLFDVAGYLLRPLHDASGLAFLSGSDPNRARAIAEGEEVKAVEGRKAMLVEMRTSGQAALADEREQYWKDVRSKQLNEVAHTRLFHLDRVLQAGEAGPILSYGGIRNTEALRALIAAVLDADCDLLIASWYVRRQRLNPTWPTRIRTLSESGHRRLGEFPDVNS